MHLNSDLFEKINISPPALEFDVVFQQLIETLSDKSPHDLAQEVRVLRGYLGQSHPRLFYHTRYVFLSKQTFNDKSASFDWLV